MRLSLWSSPRGQATWQTRTAHGETKATRGRRLQAQKEGEKQEQTHSQRSSCGKKFGEVFLFAGKQVGPDGCSQTWGPKERAEGTEDARLGGPCCGPLWEGLAMRRRLHTHRGREGSRRLPKSYKATGRVRDHPGTFTYTLPFTGRMKTGKLKPKDRRRLH